MRSSVWKLAPAVPLAFALASLACASGGSQSTTGNDASTAPERQAQAPVVAPPTAQPAPTPFPTPAPPAVAAKPPATSTSAATAATGAASPVATYLADPQAMTRATGLFRAVCTGYCHSTQPAANREAPNLFDCEWTHGSSDQQIFDTIAAGVPDTQMQGFGERLPHEDLWKLVAFIRQKSTCK
jgi:mono/diheme cytochrome c family protein